ncbi:MAG TPA: hemerythrin domain-containing protein [Bacteroidota bacterium]|nr:hemerythrin domain-containing protein [Bacteroidota bacterium]
MKPTDILKEEHRAIERLLNVLDRAAGKLERGEAVSPDLLEKSILFIQKFADGCHHQKEETLLFPAMEEKGFPRSVGPLGVMLHEHEMGRSLVSSMKRALGGFRNGSVEAGRDLAESARMFSGLLRDHIAKEDNVLFVMADQHFTENEQTRLLHRFRQVETDGAACSTKSDLLLMLEKLEQSV